MDRFSGQQFRELRRRANVRRERLALAVDRSHQSILNYERGHTVPPSDVLAKAAAEIGCDVDDFFTAEVDRVDA